MTRTRSCPSHSHQKGPPHVHANYINRPKSTPRVRARRKHTAKQRVPGGGAAHKVHPCHRCRSDSRSGRRSCRARPDCTRGSAHTFERLDALVTNLKFENLKFENATARSEFVSPVLVRNHIVLTKNTRFCTIGFCQKWPQRRALFCGRG